MVQRGLLRARGRHGCFGAFSSWTGVSRVGRYANRIAVGVMKTKSPNSTRQASVIWTLWPIFGAVAFFTGCASEPTSRVVSAPPPPQPPATQTIIVPANTNPPVAVASTTTTVPATATTPAIIIQQAPPAAQPEVVIARPSTRHMWVAGFWAWRDERYTWIPGQWVIPPRENAVWVAPRWVREGNAYRFYDGYWN